MRRNQVLIGVFITVFALCILTLLIVQLALTTPQARDVLAEQTGTLAVNSTQTGVTLGEITLTLEGIEASSGIKVLQNGNVIAVFNQQTIVVTVNDNSLIEIDGSQVSKEFKVKVENHSSNVSFYKPVNEVIVRSNITILQRVFVET